MEKYYHIDRNDQLKLSMGDVFEQSRRTPNKALTAFTYALGASSGVEDLLQTLNSFSMDHSFPILEEFANFNPDRYNQKHKRFIHKYRIELVYEYVRSYEYADQVSRFEGFYMTQEPDEWVKHLRAKPGSYIYGFAPIKIDGEQHDSTWPELSMETVDFDSIHSHAVKYWNGNATDSFRSEILCVGSLRVVDKYTLIAP